MSARLLLVTTLDLFQRTSTTHTTGTLARDINSNPIAATSPFATCWCTHGGILKAANVGSLDHPAVMEASDLLQRAAVELGHRSVTRCNDATGRQGAIRMCRRAIELHDDEADWPVAVLEGSTA